MAMDRRSSFARRASRHAGGVLFEPVEGRLMMDTLPLVTIRVSDASAAEAPFNAGEFTLRRTGNIQRPLTVSYQIEGNATNGVDFTGLATTVTIPAGRRTATLPVLPIDDLTVEGNETVRIRLLPDAAYTLDGSNQQNVSAAIAVVDDDLVPLVTIVAVDPLARESDRDEARFVITRTGPTDLPLTVNVRISGSASPGNDYDRLPTRVQIRAGRSTAFLIVRPSADARLEGDETVRVTLLAGEKFALSQTEPRKVTTWVFIEDRPLVTLTVADPLGTSFPADEAAFLLSRTGPTDRRLQVSYVLEGTAVPGVDYKRPAPLLTIPKGKSSVLIRIRGLGAQFSTPIKNVRITLRPGAKYNLDTLWINTVSCFVRLIDDGTPPAI